MKPKERKTILILSFFTFVFGAYIIFDYFKPVINVDNTQNKSISVTEKDDFFEYLGMTYGDIEKKLGKGRVAEAKNLDGVTTYKFGNSEMLFVFFSSFDLRNEESQTLIIPLRNVLATNVDILSKERLEYHFIVENWDTQSTNIDWNGSIESMYFFYGIYKDYRFDMYLDGNNQFNRNSVSMDEKVYFYKGL
jgi:hypothetical protein